MTRCESCEGCRNLFYFYAPQTPQSLDVGSGSGSGCKCHKGERREKRKRTRRAKVYTVVDCLHNNDNNSNQRWLRRTILSLRAPFLPQWPTSITFSTSRILRTLEAALAPSKTATLDRSLMRHRSIPIRMNLLRVQLENIRYVP